MARGRMINVTIASDLRLNDLSLEAHCAYLMAIPHLDRDGLMLGHPRIVAGRICPLRPELGAKMAEIIQEWVHAGLVITYGTDNGPALYFAGFQKNQSLGASYAREGKSIFPPPPGYTRTASGVVADLLMTNARPTHDLLVTNVRSTPPEVKDQDQVKDQVKGTATQPALQEPIATPQQEMFGAICEAVGWDYRVLTEKDKGQVAQAIKILSNADPPYAVEDIRHFMLDIWFHDWRWEKHGQRPTLNQLRQEIGKLRAGTPEIVPRSPNGYMSKGERQEAEIERGLKMVEERQKRSQ